MKRFFAFVLALLLCSTCLLFSVSAEEDNSVASVERLMPATFVYTAFATLSTGISIPPGLADFEIMISGVYDLQGDSIISINVKNSTYRGGINCTGHDMVLQAYETPGSRGHITWKLTGNLTFSWTDPVFGLTFETVYLESPLHSFYALNYI